MSTATGSTATVRRLPPLLPLSLRVNAATSGVSGVAAVAGATVLDDALGIASPLLIATGLGLIAYAVVLWRGSTGATVDPRTAWFAIVSDGVWVLAVAAVLVWMPDTMTTAGRWTAGILTLGVLDLAILQTVGLRRQEQR